MKHRSFQKNLLLLLLLFSSALMSQNETKFKIPKQYSLELGYRNVFTLTDRTNILPDNNATHGYGFLFDYAWQLGGLKGKKTAIYLSISHGIYYFAPR